MGVAVFFLLALGVAATGVQSACTDSELGTLAACFLNYNEDFLYELGTDRCIRSDITSTLCRYYANIVNCANSADVSSKTCRPSAISQVNGRLYIACKIEDFEAVCTDAPDIDTGGSAGLRGGWTITVAVLVSFILSSALLR